MQAQGGSPSCMERGVGEVNATITEEVIVACSLHTYRVEIMSILQREEGDRKHKNLTVNEELTTEILN